MITDIIEGMKKRLAATITVGKLVRHISRLRGGGGSALPGLVAEKLMPQFLARGLDQLPGGVIIVTGTNGKTTTTKIISDLLRKHGKKVLTNRSGSNFTRGVAATIVQQAKTTGHLDFDVAVFELDEAYAKKFVEQVKPEYVVALNVLRDQLDRFGEIDTTAKLIESVLKAATKGCVVNADDARLKAIGDKLAVPVKYFGTSAELKSLFPSDEELHGPAGKIKDSGADVELESFSNDRVSYKIDGKLINQKLEITGQYNYLNGAAALALMRLVLPKAQPTETIFYLGSIQPAFGRGEVLMHGNQPIEVLLVKNPSGFRLSLLSFTQRAKTMIAINDQHADGRDMSWLWDVDFHSLAKDGVDAVSGIRAYDMALRLQYDGVKFNSVSTDLIKSLRSFIARNPNDRLRIFCTYTAMLEIRSQLAKITKTERPL